MGIARSREEAALNRQSANGHASNVYLARCGAALYFGEELSLQQVCDCLTSEIGYEVGLAWLRECMLRAGYELRSRSEAMAIRWNGSLDDHVERQRRICTGMR